MEIEEEQEEDMIKNIKLIVLIVWTWYKRLLILNLVVGKMTLDGGPIFLDIDEGYIFFRFKIDLN